MGPGNQYVTAAKMMLQNSEACVSIDMPAGPSEARAFFFLFLPLFLAFLFSVFFFPRGDRPESTV